MMLCVSQCVLLLGKINYGWIACNGIMEGSWFLLSSVINPKFTQVTEKNPNESDSEFSLCRPRFVPVSSLIKATHISSSAKCIRFVREINGMCNTMDLYMWMIDEYGVLAALRILHWTFLFDFRPGHCLSCLMFLMNVLSSFWRMKGQYFNQVMRASTQILSVYHTLIFVLLDAISFTILTVSLIEL
jgi:hypothetical protein